MNRQDIERYLREVGEILAERGLVGEVLVLGGAYMTLVLQHREATMDVDAYFGENAAAIREAALAVARRNGIPPDWLNDAVKGFMHTQPEVITWLEVPGLRVFAPDPGYVFAMKAFAGRPQDIRDLRALKSILQLDTAAEALAIVQRYVPARLLSPRIQYLVEDLFDDAEN